MWMWSTLPYESIDSCMLLGSLVSASGMETCEPISHALVSTILAGKGQYHYSTPPLSLCRSGLGSYLLLCFNLSRLRALSHYMPCSRFSAQTLGMWPSSRTLPPPFCLPSGARGKGGRVPLLSTVGPGGRGLRARGFPAPPQKAFRFAKVHFWLRFNSTTT